MFRKKALVSMLGLCLLSCSGHAEGPANNPSEAPAEREGYTQLVNKTQAIPDGYLSETARQGEVVRTDYDTREYLAGRITKQGYTKEDFYIWAASGTNDSAYRETLNQVEGMAGLTEMFTLQNMTFHEKDGAQHDYRPTIEFIYNALPFFFPPTNTETMTNYYTRQSRISDVMNDPVFGDYGRLIFPMNTGYWSGTTLEQLALTWYDYIDPDKTVEVCNYLRAHVDNCFIDIYTEAEKQTNPELRNTGLFFFRGNSNAPFAYTTVSPYDGPTYACCGTSDGIASWRTMQSRLESLSSLGIPIEYHSYNGLPHGFGLGTGTVAEGWLQDAVHFWQSQSSATAIRPAKANTRQQDSVYSLNGIRRNTMQRGINMVDRKKIIH